MFPSQTCFVSKDLLWVIFRSPSLETANTVVSTPLSNGLLFTTSKHRDIQQWWFLLQTMTTEPSLTIPTSTQPNSNILLEIFRTKDPCSLELKLTVDMALDYHCTRPSTRQAVWWVCFHCENDKHQIYWLLIEFKYSLKTKSLISWNISARK